MLTLSYGYYKPETRDRGSVWFPRLEDNFQRLNDHTHNGTDSAPIPASNISKGTSTIAAAWTSDGGGTYHQDITMPAGYVFNTSQIRFRITNGADVGGILYPTVVRLAASQYRIFVNDNTLTLEALYV